MLPHPLTNFEIQKYYQNEPKFNGVYSRNNLPKIKDGAYVINLDECKLTGTYWVALYVNGNKIIYFDTVEVEHIPKEIKKFMGNNVQIVSIMCRYFCIGFIDFMFKDKSFLDYTKSFSPNEKKNEKNDCDKYRKFEKPKISYLLEKTLIVSIICSKCKNEEEKIFNEELSIEILNILGLLGNL